MSLWHGDKTVDSAGVHSEEATGIAQAANSGATSRATARVLSVIAGIVFTFAGLVCISVVVAKVKGTSAGHNIWAFVIAVVILLAVMLVAGRVTFKFGRRGWDDTHDLNI